MSNPLHTRVPLGCLARGVWVNLTFDLTELTAHNFGGARFSRLESIAVGAVCKLRRIFTLRDAPAELLAEEVRSRQRLLGLPARRCAPAQLLEPARPRSSSSPRARWRPRQAPVPVEHVAVPRGFELPGAEAGSAVTQLVTMQGVLANLDHRPAAGAGRAAFGRAAPPPLVSVRLTEETHNNPNYYASSSAVSSKSYQYGKYSIETS